jgi:hypothetical protein
MTAPLVIKTADFGFTSIDGVPHVTLCLHRTADELPATVTLAMRPRLARRIAVGLERVARACPAQTLADGEVGP